MSKLAFSYDPIDCPSAEELIGYKERKLAAERQDYVRHHLTFCLLCTDSLLTIRDVGRQESVQAPVGLMTALNRIARQAWEKVVPKGLSAGAGTR